MSKDVKKGVSIRSFLTTSAGAVAAGAALIGGRSIVKSIIKPSIANATIPGDYPYVPLYEGDLPALAELGRQNMVAGGGCGLNGAKTLIHALIEAGAGGDWGSLPVDMFGYGGGGVNGWGTICGALNGILAIVFLICKANGYSPNNVTDAVMKWYAETALPTEENFPGFDKARTIADSPLCHVSISR